MAKCQIKGKGCIQILNGTEYEDVIRWLVRATTVRKNLQIPAWVLSVPAPVPALTALGNIKEPASRRKLQEHDEGQ